MPRASGAMMLRHQKGSISDRGCSGPQAPAGVAYGARVHQGPPSHQYVPLELRVGERPRVLAERRAPACRKQQSCDDDEDHQSCEVVHNIAEDH
jgi:hypothetical protein